VLDPRDVVDLLGRRLQRLTESIDTLQAEVQEAADVPRLFLIEDEYRIAMTRAEAEWTRSLINELSAGTFPHLDAWQRFHETGQMPAEFTDPED
jgi:hypothetical protein